MNLPVDEKDLQLLEEYAPITLERFREFVENNLVIEMTTYEFYEFVNEYSRSAYTEAVENELEEEKYWRITNTMEALIYATYSYYAETMGYELEMELTLPEKRIFYPLGTGIAWKRPIALTEIYIKLPYKYDVKWQNEKPQLEACLEDSHVYIWRYVYENPDSDIYGEIYETKGPIPLWEKRIIARTAYIINTNTIFLQLSSLHLSC